MLFINSNGYNDIIDNLVNDLFSVINKDGEYSSYNFNEFSINISVVDIEFNCFGLEKNVCIVGKSIASLYKSSFVYIINYYYKYYTDVKK